jgi:hypothetical protein
MSCRDDVQITPDRLCVISAGIAISDDVWLAISARRVVDGEHRGLKLDSTLGRVKGSKYIAVGQKLVKCQGREHATTQGGEMIKDLPSLPVPRPPAEPDLVSLRMSRLR